MTDSIQLINVSPDDFKEQLALAVKKELAPILAKFEPNFHEKLLTRKETADLFTCSVQSIDKWAAKGKIKSYYMGNLVFYKYSELMNALETIERRKSA